MDVEETDCTALSALPSEVCTAEARSVDGMPVLGLVYELFTAVLTSLKSEAWSCSPLAHVVFSVMTRSYQGKVTRGVIRTVPLADKVTPGLSAKPQRNVPPVAAVNTA